MPKEVLREEQRRKEKYVDVPLAPFIVNSSGKAFTFLIWRRIEVEYLIFSTTGTILRPGVKLKNYNGQMLGDYLMRLMKTSGI
jgi:hypothetical protein